MESYKNLSEEDTRNMYITRNKMGNLYLHNGKPKNDKVNGLWIGEYPTSLIPFNKLFKFITWEDEEPYEIKDILDNCIIKWNYENNYWFYM